MIDLRTKFAEICFVPIAAEKIITGEEPDLGLVLETMVAVTALAFIKRPELMYKIFEHVNDDTADWIDKYLDELETYENSN